MSLQKPLQLRLLPARYSTRVDGPRAGFVSSRRLPAHSRKKWHDLARICGRSSHFDPPRVVRLPFMRKVTRPRLLSALAASLCLLGLAQAASPEWNPVRTHPVEIGPQASRLLVGFRPTAGNAITRAIKRSARTVTVTQAHTSAADLISLTQRTNVAMFGSRQITPSMHVIFLQKTLYGADVAAVLEQLRADPAVAFADGDERRGGNGRCRCVAHHPGKLRHRDCRCGQRHSLQSSGFAAGRFWRPLAS